MLLNLFVITPNQTWSSRKFLEGCNVAGRGTKHQVWQTLHSNRGEMLAAGENFENVCIFIDFGALFQLSGNTFCMLHLPKYFWGGEHTPSTPITWIHACSKSLNIIVFVICKHFGLFRNFQILAKNLSLVIWPPLASPRVAIMQFRVANGHP